MTPRRILALDMGSKTIGVAISDPLGITAQPVRVLSRTSVKRDLDEILQLVDEYHVTEIVVGHPINLKGIATPQTIKVEAFATTLGRVYGGRVTLWDERLTTAEGERVLLEGGVRRQRRRHVVNQLAAQLILQNYLEAHRT